MWKMIFRPPNPNLTLTLTPNPYLQVLPWKSLGLGLRLGGRNVIFLYVIISELSVSQYVLVERGDH